MFCLIVESSEGDITIIIIFLSKTNHFKCTFKRKYKQTQLYKCFLLL